MISNPNKFCMKIGHPSIYLITTNCLMESKGESQLKAVLTLCQDKKGTALSIGSLLFTSISLEQFSHVQQNSIARSEKICTQGCYHERFQKLPFPPLSSSRWEHPAFSGSGHEKHLKDEKCASSVDRTRLPCQNS